MQSLLPLILSVFPSYYMRFIAYKHTSLRSLYTVHGIYCQLQAWNKSSQATICLIFLQPFREAFVGFFEWLLRAFKIRQKTSDITILYKRQPWI